MPLSGREEERLRGKLIGQYNLLVDDFPELVAPLFVPAMTEEGLRHVVEAVGRRLVPLPHAIEDTIELAPVSAGDAEAYVATVPWWCADGPVGVGMRMRFTVIPPEELAPDEYGGRWFRRALEAIVPYEPDIPPGADLTIPTPAPLTRTDLSRREKSTNPVPPRFRPALAAVVHRLAHGDYAGLDADGLLAATGRLGYGLVAKPIEHYKRYPATFTDLPDQAWDYSTSDTSRDEPGQWFVCVPLWTLEEGLSGLTMEAFVWDDGTTITIKVQSVE